MKGLEQVIEILREYGAQVLAEEERRQEESKEEVEADSDSLLPSDPFERKLLARVLAELIRSEFEERKG